ncbi:MAG: large subunit ribosomal protein L21 [bacterium]|nr:MAG: large subunit ribosomal protein L21 [bacterium]
MAYAVILSGGKQFRVTPGQVVRVPTIEKTVGSNVELEALTVSDGSNIQIGTPVLDQKVKATVVEHGRGEKVIVFKFKRRKQFKRKQGHRQGFTAVRIDSLA